MTAATQTFKLTEELQVMPPLSDEEYAALKADIDRNGVQDPIVHDEDMVVIDGHHRVRACRELEIEMASVPTDKRTGLTDAEKRDLAYRLNLQRRHLESGQKREIAKTYLLNEWNGDESEESIAETLGSVSQKTVSRAKQELRESGKLSHLTKFSKAEKRRQVRDYIDDHPDASNREVADAIDADVSHATVGNWRNEWDSDDADDTDENTNGDGTEPTRELGTVGGQSVELTDTDTNGDEPAEETDADSDPEPNDEHSVVDAATQQETDEWSSPRELVEPLADTLDGFDLDPCSGAETSPFADDTYTEADDGLTQDWFGTVWVNPPYSDMTAWTDKAIAESKRDETDAIYYLCKGDSSTEWWHDALEASALVVAIDHRLSFGDGGNSAPFASHIFVFGTPSDETLQELARHGAVLSHLRIAGGGSA